MAPVKQHCGPAVPAYDWDLRVRLPHSDEHLPAGVFLRTAALP